MFLICSYFYNQFYIVALTKIILKCKKVCHQFENYKNSLKGNQLEHKIKHLEKNNIDVDQKEIIKTIN